MSNYPPGMSKRDFVRAGIDQPHAHECEFEPVETNNPFIEDGAAIFHKRCIYSEGRYGEKYQCEEERSYRFDYDTLEIPIVDEEIDLPKIGEWNDVDEAVAQIVIHIEEKYHYGNENVELNVDPDPECGEVTLTYGGFTLCFRP